MNACIFVDALSARASGPVLIPLYAPVVPAMGRERIASGRVEYVRELEGYPPVRVIADFFPDGREDFSEREFGEVRWYPYRPSEQDRARALELLLRSEA